MCLKTLTVAAVGGVAMALAVAAPASAATLAVNTTADTADSVVGDGSCADADGNCSLRAAIQEANANRGADSIRLARGGNYTLSLAGAGEDSAATGDLDVRSGITLLGRGSTLDAAGLDRAFDVLSGSLGVYQLTVVGGAPPETESGGAFRSVRDLAIYDSVIAGNVVTGEGASGGAVINDGSRLTIEGSSLTANSATRAGGGVEANEGTTTLTDVTLDNNATGPMPGNGGGLHLTGAGTVTITGGSASGNTATEEGGGLWNSAVGTFTVTGTTVSDNIASGDDPDQGGGGLFNDGGSLTVTGSVVDRNTADGTSGSGGGILNNLGTVEVSDSSVSGNTAQRAGGGVEANEGDTTLLEVDLAGNFTGPNPGNGGGLHLTGAGSVLVDGSRFRGNVAAAEGGGLWNSATGTMEVRFSAVRGNIAFGEKNAQGGGGLFNDGGSLTVRNSQVRDNTADGESGSGGGILNNLGTLRVVGVYISDNIASRAGGGIEANEGDTTLRNVSLVDNVTGLNPGNGGGLHLTGAGNVTIDGGRVVTNSAANEGGGLWNSATGTMIVTGTGIFLNDAAVGPNVFNDGGTFIIDGQPVPVGP